MTRMIALKPHRYASERKVGEHYECAAKDLRLVKALGWAAEAPAEPEPVIYAPKRAYVRRDVVAESPPAQVEEPAREATLAVDAEPEPATDKPKRAYHRRDMKAED